MAASRILMAGSALFMAVIGLALTFLPQEITLWLWELPNPLSSLMLQFLGALYLGFALTNWMARHHLIGGIFGKPLALGNFAHFLIAGIAILKAIGIIKGAPLVWGLAAAYLLLATLFGKVALGGGLPAARQNR